MSFVNVYRYKINTSDKDSWKRIFSESGKIYDASGRSRSEAFFHEEGESTFIMEMNYFVSEEQAKEVSGKVHKFAEIKALFAEFESLVVGDITSENYTSF